MSIKTLPLLIIVMLATVSNSFAGGCNPGDACYEEPVRRIVTPTRTVVREAPVVEHVPVHVPAPVMEKVVVEEETFEPCRIYASIGLGYVFLEKDEEILGHQAYDVRVGINRFLPNLSAELGVALLPDVRAREHGRSNRFALGDDTDGLQYFGDLMYHTNADAVDASFDPYVAAGLGASVYDDDLENGSTSLFGQVGVGAFMNLSERFFVKPDYRLMAVGSDTEINHKVSVSLGLKF